MPTFFRLSRRRKPSQEPATQKRKKSLGEQTPPQKIDWEKCVEFGSNGNVTYYLNDDLTPREVYVVGVAPISTTMIGVEAEEDAREEAELNAKAAFALWMQERLTYTNSREKTTLVVRTGTDKNGTIDQEEKSQTTTISKRKAERMATAMWRGMSVFWQKRKNGKYIAVWRWSVEEQEVARMVQILTQDGDLDSLKKSRKPNLDVPDIDGTFRQ